MCEGERGEGEEEERKRRRDRGEDEERRYTGRRDVERVKERSSCLATEPAAE